ncbi:MAG: LLM class F420-dependent oxidoreductase [Gammaproteobacteria bacterium]
MKIGIMYPQTEIEADAGPIREFVQGVESMGFTHLLAIEHVVGANTASRPGWAAPYSHTSIFQEPFVLLSFVAGFATSLELATGILILPQRQTVLVAKQAACLDVMCGGQLRLGVGTGWNPVEYQALGMDFGNRAERYEEQIELLRALWTAPVLSWNTRHHAIDDAGINPLPVQRPIPLWLGGVGLPPGSPLWYSPASDKVLRRIARVADGWIPNWSPDDHGLAMMARFRELCREYRRDPGAIGLEGRITLDLNTQDRWPDELQAWRAVGATHVTVNTMLLGVTGAERQLRRIEQLRAALPPGRLDLK